MVQMVVLVPVVQAVVNARGGQQMVAETNKGKTLMIHKEEEEHAWCKRVACAHSMAIKGV